MSFNKRLPVSDTLCRSSFSSSSTRRCVSRPTSTTPTTQHGRCTSATSTTTRKPAKNWRQYLSYIICSVFIIINKVMNVNVELNIMKNITVLEMVNLIP